MSLFCFFIIMIINLWFNLIAYIGFFKIKMLIFFQLIIYNQVHLIEVGHIKNNELIIPWILNWEYK